MKINTLSFLKNQNTEILSERSFWTWSLALTISDNRFPTPCCPSLLNAKKRGERASPLLPFFIAMHVEIIFARIDGFRESLVILLVF